jgi:hypothetical protein
MTTAAPVMCSARGDASTSTPRAQLVFDRGDECRNRPGIADIGHGAAASSRFLPEPLTGCLDSICCQMVESDCRTAETEGAGDSEPQTGRSAGDERELAAGIELNGQDGS